MFCGNCGAINDDKAIICCKCGQPIELTKKQNTSEDIHNNGSFKDFVSDMETGVHKARTTIKNTKIDPHIIVAVALVVIIVFLGAGMRIFVTVSRNNERREKGYAVSDLPKYANRDSQIDGETLDMLKEQAVNVFNEDTKGMTRWTDDTTLDSFNFVGYYFLSYKGEEYNDMHNMLYLVYDVKSHSDYQGMDNNIYTKERDYYWYIRFKNLIIDVDEKIKVDETDYIRVGDYFVDEITDYESQYRGYHAWPIYGCRDFDVLYDDIVTGDLDKYKVMESINLMEE